MFHSRTSMKKVKLTKNELSFNWSTQLLEDKRDSSTDGSTSLIRPKWWTNADKFHLYLLLWITSSNQSQITHSLIQRKTHWKKRHWFNFSKTYLQTSAILTRDGEKSTTLTKSEKDSATHKKNKCWRFWINCYTVPNNFKSEKSFKSSDWTEESLKSKETSWKDCWCQELVWLSLLSERFKLYLKEKTMKIMLKQPNLKKVCHCSSKKL